MSVPDETGSARLEAEGEVALAVLALDDGELGHAASHAANALGCDPTLPEAHEILARVAAVAGDGALDLYPLDGNVYIGSVVARAHLLAAAGDLDGALGLLIMATRHEPARAWASAAWLARPGVAAAFTADSLATHLMRLCAGLSDPVDKAVRPALMPYLRLVREAVTAHPEAGRMIGAASAFARRMGSPAEAVRWARRAAELDPGLLTSIWLGYAYRTAGLVDEAVKAWEGALADEPHNCAVMTDIAELLANHDRLPEAVTWIERAMVIDPHDASAFPTACALRYSHGGDVHHLVTLADHVRAHPDDGHADGMLAGTCRDRDWLGGVPAPGESVIHFLRQMWEGSTDQEVVHLRLSDLEPPSALDTVARLAPDLTVEVQAVSAPDIRLPRRPDGRVLWRYDDTRAVPAVPPPSPAAAALIAETASVNWPHPLAAYDHAVRLSGLSVEDLIGVLVHPPAPHEPAFDRRSPGHWTKTVQAWACLGLLHHAADEPWETSTRRSTLVGLLFGIEDWVSECALFALVVAAWMNPAVRADVAHLALERLHDAILVGRERPVTIDWSIARLALATPGLPAETYAACRIIAEDD
jgi:tetratricopeptide (TPR) repeat protein